MVWEEERNGGPECTLCGDYRIEDTDGTIYLGLAEIHPRRRSAEFLSFA